MIADGRSYGDFDTFDGIHGDAPQRTIEAVDVDDCLQCAAWLERVFRVWLLKGAHVGTQAKQRDHFEKTHGPIIVGDVQASLFQQFQLLFYAEGRFVEGPHVVFSRQKTRTI